MDESIFFLGGVILLVCIAGFFVYHFVFSDTSKETLFISEDETVDNTSLINTSVQNASIDNNASEINTPQNQNITSENNATLNTSVQNDSTIQNETTESLSVEAQSLLNNLQCLDQASFKKCPGNDYDAEFCFEYYDMTNCSANFSSKYLVNESISYEAYLIELSEKIPYDLKSKVICIENCYFPDDGRKLMDYDCFGDCYY